MKGKKSCPKCNKIHGARTKECSCGHVFYVKLKTESKKIGSVVNNWKELKCGQIIRVVSSDKIRGKYVVHALDDYGIESYSVGRNHYQYINMVQRQGKFGLNIFANKVRLLKND